MLKKIVDKIQMSVQGVSTPKMFSDYQTMGYIDSDKISLESVKENLVWFRRCSDLTSEQAEYLHALVQAIESNYPVQAYQLFTLYRYFQPSASFDFIDLDALEATVLFSLKVNN